MIPSLKRKVVGSSLLIISVALLAGCASQGTEQPTPTPSSTPSASPTVAKTIVYTNTQFGFHFYLPVSWTGYSIVMETWEGNNADSGSIVETGPMLSIRHPLWTLSKQRQDIPIMILTVKQWGELTQEKFHIGAAPISPSELDGNLKYVFALPARYNFAFPTGFEEVEQILKGKPLQTDVFRLEK